MSGGTEPAQMSARPLFAVTGDVAGAPAMELDAVAFREDEE